MNTSDDRIFLSKNVSVPIPNDFWAKIKKSNQITGHSWQKNGQDMGGQAVFLRCRNCNTLGVMMFNPFSEPGSQLSDVSCDVPKCLN